MGLTSNQDAQNVNAITDYLFGQTNPAGRIPSDDEFAAALDALADAAHKKLAAGITGKEVRELLAQHQPGPFPRRNGTEQPDPAVPLNYKVVADRDVYDAVVAWPDDPHETSARHFELLASVTRAKAPADGTPAPFIHHAAPAAKTPGLIKPRRPYDLTATVQPNGTVRISLQQPAEQSGQQTGDRAAACLLDGPLNDQATMDPDLHAVIIGYARPGDAEATVQTTARLIDLLRSLEPVQPTRQDAPVRFVHQATPPTGRPRPIVVEAVLGDDSITRIRCAYKAALVDDRFRVHSATCTDLAKDAIDSKHGHPLVVFGATAEEIAADLHSDFIDEGSMTPEEATDHVDFLPCTGLNT